MQAGILAKIDGDFPEVKSETWTIDSGGVELERCIEKTDTYYGVGGDVIAYQGRAALEEYVTEDSVEVSDGHIEVSERNRSIFRTTEFLVSPNGLAVVRSGSGAFAFDLLATQLGANISRADINLDSFAAENESADPWKVGFYGKSGPAENGVLYGDEIWDDPEFGELLQKQAKNQLGVDIDWNEDRLRVTMARSGYVEIYSPDELSSKRFIRFLLDSVFPHFE